MAQEQVALPEARLAVWGKLKTCGLDTTVPVGEYEYAYSIHTYIHNQGGRVWVCHFSLLTRATAHAHLLLMLT